MFRHLLKVLVWVLPVNTSSDPRHGSDSYAEYNAGAGGKISMWPGTLGIAASFDPGLMKKVWRSGISRIQGTGYYNRPVAAD